MWTKLFWKQVAERAVKTFIQTMVVAVGLGEPGADVFHLNWRAALGVAVAATVASVISSLLTAGMGAKNSPSAVEVT